MPIREEYEYYNAAAAARYDDSALVKRIERLEKDKANLSKRISELRKLIKLLQKQIDILAGTE